MIQTEQLREQILSEQGFLQKSYVLTFTANLKHWQRSMHIRLSQGERTFCIKPGFYSDICLTLINDLDNLLNVSLYSLIKDNQWVKYDPYWAKGREIESCQVISHPKGCHWIYKINKHDTLSWKGFFWMLVPKEYSFFNKYLIIKCLYNQMLSTQ